MHLQRAQGHGQPRRGRIVLLELHAEALGHVEDMGLADDGQRLDGRDVQRLLEGQAQAQRAALQQVEVLGDVAATEVGGHVHQHR